MKQFNKVVIRGQRISTLFPYGCCPSECFSSGETDRLRNYLVIRDVYLPEKNTRKTKAGELGTDVFDWILFGIGNERTDSRTWECVLVTRLTFASNSFRHWCCRPTNPLCHAALPACLLHFKEWRSNITSRQIQGQEETKGSGKQ